MKIDKTSTESINNSTQVDVEEVTIEEIVLREERACACPCTYNAN